MLGTCPSKAPSGCLPAADQLPRRQGEERGHGVFSRAGQALTPHAPFSPQADSSGLKLPLVTSTVCPAPHADAHDSAPPSPRQPSRDSTFQRQQLRQGRPSTGPNTQ